MTPLALARAAGKLALSKKGFDVKILKLKKLSSVCDYFVIVSGAVDVHVKAIADAIEEHPIPPEQLLPNLKEICRYWSLKGCVLPRMSRPWVCTWYLCPTQQANLRQKARHTQDEFSRLIQAVKVCRTKMEAEFIRIVCGD